MINQNPLGVNYKITDLSEYGARLNKQTPPVIVITGFSDYGTSCVPIYCKSISQFIKMYGYPTTPIEYYFYYAVADALSVNAKVITARLPYINTANNYFPYIQYKISDTKLLSSLFNDTTTEEEEENDKSKILEINNIKFKKEINTVAEIMSIDNSDPANKHNSGLLSLNELDSLLVTKKLDGIADDNTITIVDISHIKYKTVPTLFSETSVDNSYQTTNSCLGIMPVITTTANAVAYKYLLSKTDNPEKYKIFISDYKNLIQNEGLQLVRKITDIKDDEEDEDEELNEDVGGILTDNADIPIKLPQKFYKLLSDKLTSVTQSYFDEPSISKTAVEIISSQTQNNNKFGISSVGKNNNTNFNDVGIVVFLFDYDITTNKIFATPIEAFSGALYLEPGIYDKTETPLLENVVNSNSKYINIFVNYTPHVSEENENTIGYPVPDMFVCKNQQPTIMGLYPDMCQKIIDYQDSISEPLDIIFSKLTNTFSTRIDLVLDAGISSIAGYVAVKNQLQPISLQKILNQSPETTTIDDISTIKNHLGINIQDVITDVDEYGYLRSIKIILDKYKDFCHYTRKDCLFLADGPRELTLSGNLKKIRETSPEKTAQEDVIEKFPLLLYPDTSYGAGYFNWLLIYSNDQHAFVWIPPTCKMGKIYYNIDNLNYFWLAPAGKKRATLDNVFDVSFLPTPDELAYIYNYNWNCCIKNQDSVVIEGQKTFQLSKTAFDRINVRRLFLGLEKDITSILKNFLYEPITSLQFERITETISDYLAFVKTNAGINDFRVVCDNSNNTEETADKNIINCAIYIKPTKAIEWIMVDLVCTAQNNNIDEYITSQLTNSNIF